MKALVLALCLVSTSAFAASHPTKPSHVTKDTDDGILLLGDSIRIGYAPYVMAELPCVHEAPSNNGDSTRLLAELPGLLAGKHYRIIHFNAGLWDIAHRSDLSDRPDRLINVALAPVATDQITYFSNMYAIIDILKATGAYVIVATTTDVPAGSIGRDPYDVIQYNNILETAALNRGIKIDDLYSLMIQHDDLHKPDPANFVHWLPEGSQIMANRVINMLKNHGGC